MIYRKILSLINFLIAGLFVFIVLTSHYSTNGLYSLEIFFRLYWSNLLLGLLALANIYVAAKLLTAQKTTNLKFAAIFTILTIITFVLTFLYGLETSPYTLDVDGVRGFKTDAIIINHELDVLPPKSNWKHYDNSLFNIEILYPANEWSVSESIGSSDISVNWETVGWTGIALSRFETKNQSPEDQVFLAVDQAGWNDNKFKINFIRNDLAKLTNFGSKNAGDPRYVLLQKNQAIILVFHNYASETSNAHIPEYISAVNRGLELVAETIKTKN